MDKTNQCYTTQTEPSNTVQPNNTDRTNQYCTTQTEPINTVQNRHNQSILYKTDTINQYLQEKLKLSGLDFFYIISVTAVPK